MNNLNEDAFSLVTGRTYPVIGSIKTFWFPWKAFHQIASPSIDLQRVYLVAGAVVDSVGIPSADTMLQLMVSWRMLDPVIVH